MTDTPALTGKASRGVQVAMGLLIAAAAAFCITRVVSWMTWRQQETTFFTRAPYVRVYVRDTSPAPGGTKLGGPLPTRGFREAKITDRAAIERIWKAMDYFRRTAASPVPKNDRLDGTNACVAAITYPMERGQPQVPPTTDGNPPSPKETADADSTALEYPILIFADGRTAWGAEPQRDDYFNAPALRDAVLEVGKVALPTTTPAATATPAPAAKKAPPKASK
ncbi:MAG: hypothetical protein A3K19_25785 [Lentisphaerae bacterium RIFOXYB12_FULL_65_16]|nr:MAG: hypothetical protein A3K18_15625 [Lentisphaerae bacterium RIFOXYA12_64_32]OGV89237.1 MAG: hypothetical protein A3K19_25785 [Lentisphaerae bacterium RIFOXYB12_FULL_65_16]